jgi:hypothetical protein
VTEWKEFADLDLERLRTLVKHPIVIDGRNLYSPQSMAAAGFIYHSIGRATGVPEDMSSVATDGEAKLRIPDPRSAQAATASV